MTRLFFILFPTGLIVAFGLIQFLFLKYFHKRWWQKRWVRYSSWVLPVSGLIGVFMWIAGEYYTKDWLAIPGALTAVLSFILEFCLILSLPISGIIRLIGYLIEKADKSDEVDTKRRQVINSITAAVPLVTLSVGASGVITAQSFVKVEQKNLKIADLPEKLKGFKILHLSDLHLRHYVSLDDLSDTLEEAAKFKPNLTLVTGDIADDLTMLPDALKMISELKTDLGTFACLGNHEYFRGINKVHSLFDKSPVPLFVNKGVNLSYNDQPIFIGGIDDPRHMGAKEHAFFRNTINITLNETTSDSFKILMSHRPDALDYASKNDINLVLAGHTHGGQLGWDGRSVFESVWPDRYLWGEYKINATSLYTSCGMGHWFPFRLGCPAEAPVLELV